MDIVATLRTGLADRYRIEREIGAGGMATVYLAEDLRHARQVALKVLKPELGAVLGVERFLAEIRVTANLQHPHLLPLFDSGEVAGLLFYVMPYVAGESLRQRLDREQQFSIPESVRIATAVASALDYAHRNQVVHRDLKPENILLQDGEPVVSDFGIALAVSKAGGARITQTGLSLGTPAYMSPEQAAGDRVVDARSDVYSLGAVVYEMLIGEPPHTGANVQQVISRVLTETPRNVSDQRPTVPRPLNDAVLRALAKLPADRYDTAREFGEALKSGAGHHSLVTAGGAPVVARRSWLPWVPWAIAAAATAAAAPRLFQRDDVTPAPPLIRFAVAPPGGLRGDMVELAISANGRRLLLAAGPPGTRRVWLRQLEDDDLQELTSLTGTRGHFLSPDGRQVGFVADGRIKTMPLAGGAINTIASVAEGPFGDAPTWGANGTIVFAPGGGRGEGLMSIPASGGTATPVTTPPDGTRDGSPSFLPDGAHFVFERGGPPSTEPEIMLGDLTGAVTPLGGLRGSTPRYLNGYLTWVTGDGELRAVALDRNWHPAGEPRVLLSTGSAGPRGPRGAAYVASATGVVAYVEATRRLTELVWVDRSGRAQALTAGPRSFAGPAVAPGGNRVAVEVLSADQSSDVYTYDASGASQRITRGGRNQGPVWNGTGNMLAWGSSDADGGDSRLVVQRIDVPDSARVLLTGPGMIRPHSFTPRGDSVRAVRIAPRATPELIAVDLATGGISLYHSEPGERAASVSPDGRLVTYVATENNVSQVFVRPARAAGPILQLSEGVAESPRWGSDSRTIVFRDSASMVEVALSGDAIPRVLGRTRLFDDTYERAGFSSFGYAANRFLMLRSASEGAHIDVLVNATSLLRGRTGGGASGLRY